MGMLWVEHKHTRSFFKDDFERRVENLHTGLPFPFFVVIFCKIGPIFPMQAFGRNQRLTDPEPAGCGLLRAATISSVPSIGAENSVGYGGSPLVQTLRLA
jgi:hypothetical protein